MTDSAGRDEVAAAPRALAISDAEAEMKRLDRVHPSGYPPTRDGVRLGLACAEDELEEAAQAWRAARCKCSTPLCDHANWAETRAEIVQAAAVLLRVAERL